MPGPDRPAAIALLQAPGRAATLARHDQPPAMDPHRRDHRSGAVFLDGTVVNIALKRIGQELPATYISTLEGQAYVVSGYLAVLAALLILAGGLSDHYGRRKVFAIGLAGFGATSALCGLAPTLEWLVIFRLMQGAAGALLVPGSLSLITQAFSGAARGRAFGMWAASTSALTVLGPIVGGTMVDTIGWRSAFLINVPVTAFALWVTLRHVEESRDSEATGSFDWLGALVAALAVGGLAFGLIRGQAHEWNDTLAWGAITVGVISLILFPILMATRPNPLVPLSLFKSRAFTSINLTTFFVYGALYVNFWYTSLVFQGVLGYTATGAALIGLPTGVMLALLSTRIGTLAGRLGARRFLVAGPSLMAVALLWYSRLPADFGAVEGRPRDAVDAGPAGRRPHRRPAGRAPLRPRHLVRGRAADQHADGLDLDALLGPGIRDQQLDLARRPAAARSVHLHRGERDVLRHPRRARADARHVVGGGAGGVPAAQPAAARRDARTDQRGDRGIDGRVPPRDARVGGPARDRRA